MFVHALVAIAVNLCGCSSTEAPPEPGEIHAPGKTQAGVTSDCTPYATYVEGPYRYVNEQWGSSKATGPFEQCVLMREREGRTEYGWSWNWPVSEPTVFAYPEAVYGWKPWAGGPSTDERFPYPLRDLDGLVLDFDVEIAGRGSYNLAPEVWLIREGELSEKSLLITTEVMFWLDAEGDARPAGTVVATPVIDGVQYELWVADNFGDRGDGRGWTALTFRARTVTHRGALNIHALLEHLVEQGRVNPADSVASVEFGTEVFGGSGTLWLRELTVKALP